MYMYMYLFISLHLFHWRVCDDIIRTDYLKIFGMGGQRWDEGLVPLTIQELGVTVEELQPVIVQALEEIGNFTSCEESSPSTYDEGVCTLVFAFLFCFCVCVCVWACVKPHPLLCRRSSLRCRPTAAGV